MSEERIGLLERALARINADPARLGPDYRPWSGQEEDAVIEEQRRLEAEMTAMDMRTRMFREGQSKS